MIFFSLPQMSSHELLGFISPSFDFDVIRRNRRNSLNASEHKIADPRSRGINEIDRHLQSDKISIRSRRA